jgi:creatinine amidohydrolase
MRPDLVDLSLLKRKDEPGSGGRLALGDDADEADAAYGRMINEAIIAALGETTRQFAAKPGPVVEPAKLSYDFTESLWRELKATLPAWTSVSPKPGQAPAPKESRWHGYQHVADVLARARP